MYEKILAIVTSTLKQIQPGIPIYEDSVMQSDKAFYFVLSIEDNVTENIGLDVQNKGYLVDVALVDNKNNKKRIREILDRCGSFFNVINLDGNQIFPEDYTVYETDGVKHIQFLIAFSQLIEWSEE